MYGSIGCIGCRWFCLAWRCSLLAVGLISCGGFSFALLLTCTRPGWSTQPRTCGAGAASSLGTTQRTTGGWRCSLSVKAGITTIMHIQLRRDMGWLGTKSILIGGASE